ncbi:hypothetical protein Pla110_23860 [Polystyrenella longa]|uniref:Uncharacterized protein n=1 Tax=Polystyrenella longa TaxID=2528007 RepID=A0A518CN84_9PLAN|nr:hypothetical protein [Polystyrenella longa]QDU80654.1 hypothetical protein Pla110_23860 [Polystyrenella longa]
MPCSMVSTPSSRTTLKLTVPRTDNSLLVAPSWQELPCTLACNQAELAKGSLCFLGKSEAELRNEARTSVVCAAQAYLDSLGIDQSPQSADGPILMGGHQPTLFHPGVWVKNFAIAELANITGGTAINLVIDNDLAESTRFNYPDEVNGHLKTGAIDFGSRLIPQPWEELSVPAESLLDDYADALSSLLGKWDVTPAIKSVWQEACQKAPHNLSQIFTTARILLERQLGVNNLELPISLLSEEEPFLRFSLHLMVNIERFRSDYNQQLAAYRHRNKIRNEQHPVPDLAVEGVWQEAPFWIWKAGATHRHHVWIQITDEAILLSDGTEELARIPHPNATSPEQAIQSLAALAAEGIRFRPRALTTTLYARLFLCDLFIHGIGGAKYDEVTDDLIREFYQHEPPGYLTLSGTIWFPLHRNIDVAAEDMESLKDQIRDLQYHPDQHLSSAQQETARTLLKEREQLVEEQNGYKNLSKEEKRHASDQNRIRFQRLKEIARELTLLVAPEQKRLQAELKRLEALWEERQVQINREYPALFYPVEKLIEFTQHLQDEIRIGFSAS